MTKDEHKPCKGGITQNIKVTGEAIFLTKLLLILRTYFKHQSDKLKMSANTPTVKIPADVMESEFKRILLKHHFTESKASTIAQIYTVNSLEGVYTHGVNRFAKFIKYVIDGHIKPDKEPICIHSAGGVIVGAGVGPGSGRPLPVRREIARTVMS